MIVRPTARSFVLVAVMLGTTEFARAGVWGTEPVLGVGADYATNPALLDTSRTAETRGALLLDAPTDYHANDVTFSVQPSFRITDSPGYSSLASDYAHLRVAYELDSERNTLTASGQLARDSSLYYNYTQNGSTGVRRDTTSADVGWVRKLTERWNFNWDINTSRVLYDNSASSFATLTDYRYSTASPGISWIMNERTTLSIAGMAGLYDATSGTTKSSNYNVQLGIKRRLNDVWTLNMSAGYSRENNEASQYVLIGYEIVGGFIVPVYQYQTFSSTTTGSIYTADLTRVWRLFSMTATASRSLVPTGFSYLARQDTYLWSFDYPCTPRWTIDGRVRWLRSIEPQVEGPTINDAYWEVGISVTWQVTEKWSLNLGASRVNVNYDPPGVNVGSTGVSLRLFRHFNRIEWH